jgi:hypothetical protein
MKTKRFEKKLVLNKKTISDLTPNQMNEIKGGITDTCITMDPDENCTYTIGKTSHAASFFPTLCYMCIP